MTDLRVSAFTYGWLEQQAPSTYAICLSRESKICYVEMLQGVCVRASSSTEEFVFKDFFLS